MSINSHENSLLNAVRKSFVNTYSKSDKDTQRSSKKVDEIHGLIASQLHSSSNNGNYKIISKITDGSEYLTKGKFFDKRTNIAIIEKKSNEPVAFIEFKMPMNSIMKNQHNTFENMLGSTYNVRSANVKVFWVYFIPRYSPDLKKDKTIRKFNELKASDLEFFERLYENDIDINKELAIPNGLSLNIYDVNYKRGVKTKDELIEQVTELSKSNDLKITLEKTKKINNGLYINSYNEFINYIWKEIKNER